MSLSNFLLVGFIVVATPPAEDGEEPEARSAVAAVHYDLSALTRADTFRSQSVPGPTFDQKGGEWEVWADSPARAFDVDRFVDLVMSSVAPEQWELGLARLSGDERGILVLAEDELQRDVGAVVDLFHRAWGYSPTLEISVFRGASDAIEGGGRIARVEADRRLGEALRTGSLEVVHRARVTLGAHGVRGHQDLHLRERACDFDSEVAASVAVLQTTPRVFQSGLIAAAVGRSNAEGTWLAFALHSSTPLPDRQRVVHATTTVPSEDGVRVVDEVLTLDIPEEAFGHWAGTAYLPRGSVLWIRGGERGPNGGFQSTLVELRVEDEPAAANAYFADLSGPQTAVLVAPPRSLGTTLKSPRPGLGMVLGQTVAFGDEPDSFTASSLERDLSFSNPALPLAYTDPRVEETCWIESGQGDWTYAVVPDDYAVEFAQLLQQAAVPGRTYLVEGRLLDSHQETQSNFSLVIEEGSDAHVWIGDHRRLLAEWEVDIAERASIWRPELEQLLDAYALTFSLSSHGGKLNLRVEGVANLLDEPIRERAGAGHPGRIVELGSAVGFQLDQALTLEPGGTASIPGSVTLELTVTPLTEN